jgi:molybdopterin converting factor small subunit
MVEIRYDKHSEHINLAGKSIAEVREQYKSKFDLPDKAKAMLNDKGVRRQHEAETKLADNDKLYFEVKNKRGFYFATALLVALVATGGLFAYAYTTASTSITATSKSADFAAVAANNTMAGYNVFGSYRGSIGAGNLFNVTPATGYDGDLEVNVYLTNADQLSRNYGMFLMRLEFVDSANVTFDLEHIEKPLTLNNGVVTFLCDNLTAGTTYYVKCVGGVYRSFPWAFLSGQTIFSPNVLCEVVQAGL